ncbi:MAG TPA: GxxExxY protein [Bacteroidia bacterium]|nr:GxxExxY protein [Bacteroidia bacterium]
MEKRFERLTEEEENLGRAVVDAAYKVHRELGPGLMEKVYEVCLVYELRKRGIACQRQILFPIIYDGQEMDEALRLDILVADLVIIEAKARDEINPVWPAQVLSHLKHMNKRLGFLINFNVPLIKNGIKRFVR